ncbi:hypothetical protein MLD38_009559 [Melastoma candidum]|uniref:Uncharacterized protein n=1 Tax=Melastoma candidum TaxID=119954 RepID=A0ACB9RXM1_9MYRT|nr:hypothetical protein MLD38_009559 [Melastoma candidum]
MCLSPPMPLLTTRLQPLLREVAFQEPRELDAGTRSTKNASATPLLVLLNALRLVGLTASLAKLFAVCNLLCSFFPVTYAQPTIEKCAVGAHCNKPGTICQDPRFIGGDGITFYFHGKKDRDFCIVTDPNLHINAHFIGLRNHRMKRDFTWVQSLGILFGNHKLFIGAQKTETWDDVNDRLSLSFDGEPISIPQVEGAEWTDESSDTLSITRLRGANAVLVDAPGVLQMKAIVVPITQEDSLIHNYGITQEDCFAHLDMSFKFYSLSPGVSGVLGQTYAANYISRANMGMSVPVLGGEREFSSSDLFTADCSASRFLGEQSAPHNSGANYEDDVLSCASGMGGRGVVCKR